MAYKIYTSYTNGTCISCNNQYRANKLFVFHNENIDDKYDGLVCENCLDTLFDAVKRSYRKHKTSFEITLEWQEKGLESAHIKPCFNCGDVPSQSEHLATFTIGGNTFNICNTCVFALFLSSKRAVNVMP